MDTESGLTFVRHRMYDPRLGRFTQTDPILGNRPFAHYSYGSNNPVSLTDPWGLQDVDEETRKRWLKPNADYNRENPPPAPYIQMHSMPWDYSDAEVASDYIALANRLERETTPNAAAVIMRREAQLRKFAIASLRTGDPSAYYEYRSYGRAHFGLAIEANGAAMAAGPALTAVAQDAVTIVRGATTQSAPTGTRAPGEMVAARMRTANMGDTEVDPAVANQVWRIANEDPVASASLKQINKYGDVTLDFGKPPPIFERDAGVTLGNAREARIFMKNNSGPYEATSTMVHESWHLSQAARGNRIGTQTDEYRAFRREFLFTQQRRPTLEERAEIRLKIKGDPVYSQKPEGE